MGNVVNRVFDSSGPEGKVRGTPQQIIDKYTQLARDAHLANDRVAVENFQQHAEHYTRLLGEALKEQEARREQQEAQNRNRQQNQNRDQKGGDQPSSDPGSMPQPDVQAPAAMEAEGGDAGLVETPEASTGNDNPAPKQSRRPRRNSKPVEDNKDQPAEDNNQEAAE